MTSSNYQTTVVQIASSKIHLFISTKVTLCSQQKREYDKGHTLGPFGKLKRVLSDHEWARKILVHWITFNLFSLLMKGYRSYLYEHSGKLLKLSVALGTVNKYNYIYNKCFNILHKTVVKMYLSFLQCLSYFI